MSSEQKKKFRKAFFKTHRKFRENSVEFKNHLRALEKNFRSFFKEHLKKSEPKVAAFEALPSEPPLADWLIEEGVSPWFPVISGEKLFLRRGEESQLFESMDLIFVPGLLVNTSGYRLGRGKGYYDRTLENIPRKKSIFVGFDWQVRRHLPIENHDMRTGWIVTESRIWNCT